MLSLLNHFLSYVLVGISRRTAAGKGACSYQIRWVCCRHRSNGCMPGEPAAYVLDPRV